MPVGRPSTRDSRAILSTVEGPLRRLAAGGGGMHREPATGGKRFGVSSQTRSQAVGPSRVERDHARGSDRATPAASGQERPESAACRAAARSPASEAPATDRRHAQHEPANAATNASGSPSLTGGMPTTQRISPPNGAELLRGPAPWKSVIAANERPRRDRSTKAGARPKRNPKGGYLEVNSVGSFATRVEPTTVGIMPSANANQAVAVYFSTHARGRAEPGASDGGTARTSRYCTVGGIVGASVTVARARPRSH